MMSDDTNCPGCSFNSMYFRMWCYTYYNSALGDPTVNAVQSDYFYVSHRLACDNSANYLQVAGTFHYSFV